MDPYLGLQGRRRTHAYPRRVSETRRVAAEASGRSIDSAPGKHHRDACEFLAGSLTLRINELREVPFHSEESLREQQGRHRGSDRCSYTKRHEPSRVERLQHGGDAPFLDGNHRSKIGWQVESGRRLQRAAEAE